MMNDTGKLTEPTHYQSHLLRLWRAAGMQLVDMALDSSGRWLAAASGQAGEVYLWDMSSGQLAHTLPGGGWLVHGVAFSQDGRSLATVGSGHSQTQSCKSLFTPG